MKREEVEVCVEVIRNSFLTVAKEYKFTQKNAPRFTAYATTAERLYNQYEEKRPMYVAIGESGKIVGYYSLQIVGNEECELNNLCVLPEYRHKKIGEELLEHAFASAKSLGCEQMNIGIVEENTKLLKWYEAYGVKHISTKKYSFFPFTCGYMMKKL